jgi:glycosyltransferase involved in cell wall biosynthesis
MSRERLRILHVSPYAPAAWAYGGIPRVVASLTRGLARRDHLVTLCATDACDADNRLSMGARRAGHGPWSTSVDGVTWRLFSNVSNRAAYSMQAFAPIGLRRYLATAAGSFDIAHLHACHNLPGILAARALGRAGVPFVLSPNGTAPIFERRRLAKRVLGWIGGAEVASNAARLLAVSGAEERQLHALGVEPLRVRRLANPLDLSEFAGLSNGGELRQMFGIGRAPVILFLGKITPRKHVSVLVEAFARLPLSDARLVLAGSDMGGLKAALTAARQCGVHERVHVAGVLAGVDRLRALRDASVVAYPTEAEVFGLVACEAVLAGTPVVVGADSGNAEVIGATGGGLCVPPGNVPALTEALLRILSAPADWRRQAERAAPRMRVLVDEQTVAAALEQIYDEVLGIRRLESMSA